MDADDELVEFPDAPLLLPSHPGETLEDELVTRCSHSKWHMM